MFNILRVDIFNIFYLSLNRFKKIIFLSKTFKMAQLIANLINETMTAAQIAQFQRGIQMALDALPKKPILSNEDYAKIPKKGEARRKWADQMLEVAKAFPEFVPNALKLADVQNDNTLNNQLFGLKEQYLDKLVDVTTLLLGVSGGEELNGWSRFVDNVRTGAKDKEPNAIEALNRIENIENTSGGRSKRKKTKG
jgi:hypothetical protein